MSISSATSAIRDFSADTLKLAISTPSTFANRHGIDVSEAIGIIQREAVLRKSHKIWRK